MRHLNSLLVILFVLALGLPAEAQLHVDAARGTLLAAGTAAKPYKTLQQALNRASSDPSITEIRIAAGTYTPGSSASDAFDMVQDVDIRGGYKSGSLFTVRDPVIHVTILSGEIGSSSLSDNCRTVLRAENVTGVMVSGVTISGGYGSNSGGAIFVYSSGIGFDQCIIRDSQAENGGGAFIENAPSVWFTRCEFIANQAREGGAIKVVNYNLGQSVLVNRCWFEGNTAEVYGGGVDVVYGEVSVFNSAFRDQVGHKGGACSIHGSTGSLKLVNVTTSENSANEGGSVYVSLGSLVVRNSILWDDSADYMGDEIYQTSSGAAAVEYSNVMGGFAGTGNLGSDPGFTDSRLHIVHPIAGYSPCADSGNNALLGGAHLQLDLDGKDRVMHSLSWMTGTEIVDRGAYEHAPLSIIYPGSLDLDFGLTVRVNGAAGNSPGTDIVTVQAGDLVELELRSASGQLAQFPVYFGHQIYVPGIPPGGFPDGPDTHLDPWATFDLVQLPFNHVFHLPPEWVGVNVMVQGFAIVPFGNGYVATDGRELRFR